MINGLLTGTWSALVMVAAAVVVFVLVWRRSRSTARIFGTVGAILLVVAQLSPVLYTILMATPIGNTSFDRLYLSSIVQNVTRGVCTAAAVVLLARCVVLSNRPQHPGADPN